MKALYSGFHVNGRGWWYVGGGWDGALASGWSQGAVVPMCAFHASVLLPAAPGDWDA